MRPHLFALTVAAAIGACDLSPSNPIPPFLTVTPILDSMFVGDSRPPRTVTLYDANLVAHDPGPVTWSINPDTVAAIDSTTGAIHGLHKGPAVITAHAAGLTAPALVVVSRRLDMTLLMDTVFLLPGDTFTIPLAIQKKDMLAADTVWFEPSPSPAIDTINTATGLVAALSGGGPVKYIAHVATSTDTVSDTGAVQVTIPSATGGGLFYMTVVGTAIRHEGGWAYAMNYMKTNGKHAFRLTDSLISADSTFYERLMITLPDSVITTRAVAIDSINPQEASVSIGTLNAICNPPRAWGLWSSVLPIPGIRAYSNLVYPPSGTTDSTGYLSITRYQAVSGGLVIGGRVVFTARRTDLYYDSLGIETIHGTFVAPLVQNDNLCPS